MFAFCAGAGHGEREITSTGVLAVYEKPLDTSCLCMHSELVQGDIP